MKRFIDSIKNHVHGFECEKHKDSYPELPKASRVKNVKDHRVKFALMTKVEFIQSDDEVSTWYKVSVQEDF